VLPAASQEGLVAPLPLDLLPFSLTWPQQRCSLRIRADLRQEARPWPFAARRRPQRQDRVAIAGPCYRHRGGSGCPNGLPPRCWPPAAPASWAKWLPRMHISTALPPGSRRAAPPELLQELAKVELKPAGSAPTAFAEYPVQFARPLPGGWSMKQHRFGGPPAQPPAWQGNSSPICLTMDGHPEFSAPPWPSPVAWRSGGESESRTATPVARRCVPTCAGKSSASSLPADFASRWPWVPRAMWVLPWWEESETLGERRSGGGGSPTSSAARCSPTCVSALLQCRNGPAHDKQARSPPQLAGAKPMCSCHATGGGSAWSCPRPADGLIEHDAFRPGPACTSCAGRVGRGAAVSHCLLIN